MIKFKTTGPDGVPGYGFGLSEENIRRLKKGQPILCKRLIGALKQRGYDPLVYLEDLIATLEERSADLEE